MRSPTPPLAQAPGRHRALVTTFLAVVLGALVVAGLPVAPASAAPASRVSGWGTTTLRASTGTTLQVRVAVRPATASLRRTVLLQRRAASSKTWTTIARARSSSSGAVVLTVPTAAAYDGHVRLRVTAARKARALTTAPRRLVVQRTAAVTTPSHPTPTTPTTPVPPTTEVEAEVVRLVNLARATARNCGSDRFPAAAPLRIDDRLSLASRLHALDMGTRAYFSHTSLDGRSPWDRSRAAGYATAGGENIAAGYRTPAEVVEGWIESPGHCRNLMAADMVDLGVGFAEVPGSPYRTYWVQMFGRG